MCGINGIFHRERRVSADVILRMRDVLRHRGPDEEGIFVEKNVGLGHRRLSIVDLKTGQQPMFNEDRSCVIVYNGEVYNHRELRPDLIDRGYRFRTSSDTETILRLYEAEGSDCVQKLRGMFAFAIWDSRKEQLFIARDRFGVKPLYYVTRDDGSFYFASEIKALISAEGVRPKLNYSALPDYLANHGTSDNQTLFEGIRRLPPGHTLTLTRDDLKIDKYWDLRFEPKLEGRSEASLSEEWMALFEDAVRLRLMADVPLGTFLSGGIDSSAITAVMSKMVSEPIKTFSVAFAEREANELEYARLVAERFGTEHHDVIVAPDEFFGSLPDLVWHEDEPIAHPSSVALNFVSRLASKHVKVVLTGEGSDESLAGYGRYHLTLKNLRLGKNYTSIVPERIREFVNRRLEAANPGSRLHHKLKKSFLCVEPTIEAMYFDNFSVFSGRMQSGLLSESTKEQLNGSADPYVEMSAIFNKSSGDLLDKMLATDLRTYLHELLMKQDQMSMAASIESRVPFLDHKLVEFTSRLPNRMKLRGNTTKYVLRRAMNGILPEEILTRPKMGFPVPVGSWFRGKYRHLVEEYVLSERSLDRGIFEPAYVRYIVERHMLGENHDERLWALLNFELWHRRFIDEEHPTKLNSMQDEDTLAKN